MEKKELNILKIHFYPCFSNLSRMNSAISGVILLCVNEIYIN